MTDGAVAETINIELERFKLYNGGVGHIVHDDGGEVRIARARAKASEFRNLEVDDVVPLWPGIRPRLKLIALDLLLPIISRRAHRTLFAHASPPNMGRRR